MTDHTRLRELAEKATPGPWFTSKEGADEDYRAVVALWMEDEEHITDDGVWKPNAQFIAACDPSSVLALLDELETARRGQGTYHGANTPTPEPFHETHPIPSSTEQE